MKAEEHNPLIQFTSPTLKTMRPMPKKTSDIEKDDPYAYLDEDACIVWMAGDGVVYYMNSEGEAASVPDACKIHERLGIFRGIAVDRSGEEW